jgi:hypothetical protein
MGELAAVAHRHAHHFLGAERVGVKANRLDRAVDDEIGRNAVIPFGNVADGHLRLLTCWNKG